MTGPEQPRRRLADLLVGEQHLDTGRRVAEEFTGQDRYDPARPTLSVLVAGVIAEAEERGREEVRAYAREREQAERRKLDAARAEVALYLDPENSARIAAQRAIDAHGHSAAVVAYGLVAGWTP